MGYDGTWGIRIGCVCVGGIFGVGFVLWGTGVGVVKIFLCLVVSIGVVYFHWVVTVGVVK